MPRAANKDSMSYLVLRKPETLLYKAKVWDYRFQNVVFSRFFFRNRLMCHDIIILKQTLLRQWVIRKLSLTVRTVGDRGQSSPLPLLRSCHCPLFVFALISYKLHTEEPQATVKNNVHFLPSPRPASSCRVAVIKLCKSSKALREQQQQRCHSGRHDPSCESNFANILRFPCR